MDSVNFCTLSSAGAGKGFYPIEPCKLYIFTPGRSPKGQLPISWYLLFGSTSNIYEATKEPPFWTCFISFQNLASKSNDCLDTHASICRVCDSPMRSCCRFNQFKPFQFLKRSKMHRCDVAHRAASVMCVPRRHASFHPMDFMNLSMTPSWLRSCLTWALPQIFVDSSV